jgi:hypothetical protein
MSKSQVGKEVTREQAARMLERAISGSRQLGLDDVADRYAEMDVDTYVTEKGLVLINPVPQSTPLQERRKTTMANAALSTITKADLETENGELLDLLNDIWSELADVDSTTNKAQMVAAIDSVCELLNDYDPETFPMEGDEEESDDAEEEAA